MDIRITGTPPGRDRRTCGLPGFAFVVVLLTLMCVAASCGPARPVGGGPRCAFADPQFMTSLGICNIVAEYYVANHEWPLTKTQLEEQWQRMMESTKQDVSPEEAKELSNFLARFTLLDLRQHGDHLIFHYRFKAEAPGKIVDQRLTFRPGATADDILQTATEEHAD